MMGMDAIEIDALHDASPPSDLVTARVDAPTDALTAPDVIDAGAPLSSMTLTGSFVGGAVSGANEGITLVGHLGWCAVVSGSNEGITLEGVLR